MSEIQGNVSILVEMVHELRAIGVETAAGLEETREDVRFGITTTERQGDNLSQQLTRVGRELKEATLQAYQRSSFNPIEMLWVWWRLVWQYTVIAWELSFTVTRNTLAITPPVLFCCSLGCIMVESCVLIFITDVGLIFATAGLSHYFGLQYQL